MYNLYTLFPANFGPPSEGYPYGTPRNSSSAGAKDGSPWNASVMKDIFGAMWAVLESGGETANGTAESASSSQFVISIYNMISDVIRNTLFQKIVTPSMLHAAVCAYEDTWDTPVYWRTQVGATTTGHYLYPYNVLATNIRYALPYSNTILRSAQPVAKALLYLDAAGAALPNGSRPRIRKIHLNTATGVEVFGDWLEMSAVSGPQTLVFPHPVGITYGLVGSWKYEIDHRAVLNGSFRVFGLDISGYNT